MTTKKKSSKPVEKTMDVLATSADFDHVVVDPSPLSRLALYWAVVKYDPDFRSGKCRFEGSGENG